MNMIYIVIRKTLDWQDEAAFQAQIPVNMRYGIELWNSTFNVPFHQYRAELKRIAQLNLSRVEGIQCLSLPDIPTGSIVVPADDDDWFAPDMAQVLQRYLCDCEGYYWPSRFLEVPLSPAHHLYLIRRKLFPFTKPYWLCTTNNYAVRYNSRTADLPHNHVVATQWFLAHPSVVKRIELPISLMNRTLASMTHLRTHPSRTLLLRKYRRYRELYDQPVPKDLAWCKPYVDRMRDLHSQLRLR
jgi:hypothetical protein